MPAARAAPSQGGGAAHCKIKLGTADVEAGSIHSVVIDLMVNMADMATLTLNNTNAVKFSHQTNLGDRVEVKLSDKVVFTGEVSGIEPTWAAGGECKVVLRCFSMVHRMTRGKFSKTYEKQTFKDICNTLAQKYGLTAKVDGALPTGQFEHIYQHVQSDYDFLMQWAGRVGAELLTNDKELILRPKNPRDAKNDLELSWGDAHPTIEKFAPRLTTAGMVQKVVVRAWNPDKNEELEGTCEVGGIASKLGKEDGGTQAKSKVQDNKEVFFYDADVPCFSKAECEQIAKAKMEEILLNHITGDLVLAGNPDLKAGSAYKIKVNDPRFDGHYRFNAVQHRMQHSSGGDQGFKTHCRVQRNATGEG
jgi:phage protein D